MSFADEFLTEKKDISLCLAKKIAGAVRLEAEKLSVKAVTAVYNSGARPVLVEVMDGAFIASFDIASGKAYTSAALKMPTKVLKNLAQPGSDLYGVQNTNSGKIVVFGGGEPLVYKGCCVGAVGVSGGTEDEDTYLGEVAARAFAEAAKNE